MKKLYKSRRRRAYVKFYTMQPYRNNFFSFYNEWFDYILDLKWEYFLEDFYYRWSHIPFRKRDPNLFLDSFEDDNYDDSFYFFYGFDYFEKDFNSSEVFVNSVPFDDDEDDEWEMLDTLSGPIDDFSFDDFFFENFFIVIFFSFWFFPSFFPFLLVLYTFCYSTDEFLAFDDTFTEVDDSWSPFELSADELMWDYILGPCDSELDQALSYHTFAEFIFIEFLSFDEFFFSSRFWAHKPYFLKHNSLLISKLKNKT